MDHAISVIMGQNRCSADDAFDILRRASNDRNVRISRLAAETSAAAVSPSPTQIPAGDREGELSAQPRRSSE